MAHVPTSERRTQLIEAAVRVISREGVGRATTRRIADEAGAPLASLHYSFRDKEELFAAVLEHAVACTYQLVCDRGAPPGAGLAAAVRAFLEIFQEWTSADPDLQSALYALTQWKLHATGHEGAAAREYRAYFDGLIDIFRAAARPGETDVDLDKLARLTMALNDGMVLQLLAVGGSAFADIDLTTLAEGLVRASAGAQP
ncbi:TetR/AcrR family transcriptional regulator [Pseudonocardia eucalypti]|uniref:TetR/AcrR family transcriptional regulator n=1 Tax=Pseudonocardia eucalypti TaxID=648755 RepID=A0ABP9PFR8_9PSEU|nr:AcrR family transcriptional regulator [Pseudonocardia eucalypti]